MKRYLWGLALLAPAARAEPAGPEEALRALEAAQVTAAERACLEMPLAEAAELLALAERIGGAQRRAEVAGDAARAGTLARQQAVVVARAREALVEAALCLGPRAACRLLGEACPEGEAQVWVEGGGDDGAPEIQVPWEPPLWVDYGESPFQ